MVFEINSRIDSQLLSYVKLENYGRKIESLIVYETASSTPSRLLCDPPQCWKRKAKGNWLPSLPVTAARPIQWLLGGLGKIPAVLVGFTNAFSLTTENFTPKAHSIETLLKDHHLPLVSSRSQHAKASMCYLWSGRGRPFQRCQILTNKYWTGSPPSYNSAGL